MKKILNINIVNEIIAVTDNISRYIVGILSRSTPKKYPKIITMVSDDTVTALLISEAELENFISADLEKIKKAISHYHFFSQYCMKANIIIEMLSAQ